MKIKLSFSATATGESIWKAQFATDEGSTAGYISAERRTPEEAIGALFLAFLDGSIMIDLPSAWRTQIHRATAEAEPDRPRVGYAPCPNCGGQRQFSAAIGMPFCTKCDVCP